MRSIRRSLLGYLLLLLAVALTAVGTLVDRFANAAISSRKESEEDRIEQTFKVRQIEAKSKFDADLMAESKALAREVHSHTRSLVGQNPDPRPRPGTSPPSTPKMSDPPVTLKATDDEARQFRLRSALLELAPGPALWPAVAPVAAVEPLLRGGNPQRHHPFPNWAEFEGPRAIARLQEALRKTFAEDHPPHQFQLTLVAVQPGRPGRIVHTVHSEKVRDDLPLDEAQLESPSEVEPQLDDKNVPGLGLCRRVVAGTHANGRPLGFWLVLPSPPAPTVPPGQPLPSAYTRYPQYPPFRGPDFVVRVVVHVVRPYSELDARLAADQKERDDQLSRVRTETRMELAQLRSRLIAIGTGTFVALVLGGWFMVARGLAPLRKLSDAVSRVSEKDFHLSVEPAELGRELAPIHARIAQTLGLLQRAFAREKQAVADISHELRTPIASLLATIDVTLRKKDRPSEQYRTALEECRLIAKQLGQLVERIMTLASLDAGNDHTQIARTDASELATGCVAVIRPLAAANNLSVTAHVPDELPLDTDAAKLREVLMNLLHNAVEYNKPGGTIELAVRQEDESAVFEVRDTGIGMALDVREKIFERFYRADASRHATGVHAGLGLAIVKEYVARLNGSLSVESEPGAGTTFRVTLPLGTSGLPQPAPAADRAKPRDTVAASS